jgi:hypothetical protein
MFTRRCQGPLHKGALVPESDFRGFKTCRFCLERNNQWKARHIETVRAKNSWSILENRLRINLYKVGITGKKKEDVAALLKPGMGWGNYYVKGKRSWKFVLGSTSKEPEAVWS